MMICSCGGCAVGTEEAQGWRRWAAFGLDVAYFFRFSFFSDFVEDMDSRKCGLGPKCKGGMFYWLSTGSWLLSPEVGGPEFESRPTAFIKTFMVSKNYPPSSAALPYTRLPNAHRQAAQHSQGIQTLLEAEKDAAKVVQEARQCACL